MLTGRRFTYTDSDNNKWTRDYITTWSTMKCENHFFAALTSLDVAHGKYAIAIMEEFDASVSLENGIQSFSA